MSTRLDAVEIKVSIGSGGTNRAIDTLDLRPDRGEIRRIYFCEAGGDAPFSGAPALALFSRGIILRLRDKETAGEADSTVKFRPFEPALLSDRWRRTHKVDGGELRVEGDWTGSTHNTAASLVVEQQRDDLAAVAIGKRPLTKLFSPEQRDFLAEHASPVVDLNPLRVLGPIDAVKWEPEPHGFSRDLVVERWSVDELEFLELSVRTDEPDEAEQVQAELDRFLRKRDLLLGVVQETKTRTVLEYLSRRAQ